METSLLAKKFRLILGTFAILVNLYPVLGQKLNVNNSIYQNIQYPEDQRVITPIEALPTAGIKAAAGSIAVNENALYNTYTPAQLVQNILVSGCITASNITYAGGFNVGDPTRRQLGYFNQGSSTFPMTEGLILSSGYVTSSEGPNNATGSSNALGLAGDPDLTLLAGAASHDASVLQFDFIPSGNILEFQYIFSSEEYLEYCCSAFNDAFGFFLSGPGITGPFSNSSINIALIPSTAIPVTINNVHSFVASNAYGNPCPAQNAIYYIDNPPGTLATQFDGMTVVLTATYNVTRCATYHIKLAVGDVADDKLNSAVFLQARSFSSSPPVLTCPNDTLIECGTSILPASTGTASTTDNCVVVNLTYTDVTTNGSCTGNYSILRTWTVADLCGGTASCNQTITIEDNTAPVWTSIPGSFNTTIECSDPVALTSALSMTPIASDLCSAVIIGGPVQVITPGGCPGNYTISRTWTLADDCGNNGVDFTQLITVIDTVAPTWNQSNGSLDATVACDDPAALATAMAQTPTAGDICGLVSITGPVVANIPGSCPGNYIIVRTWNATDACGNMSAFIQTITVQDINPPILAGVPGNITVECSAIPAPPIVTATDNCGPNPVVVMTQSITTGLCINNYSITRTWTASDICNNVTSASQVITVQDNTPPNIITCALSQSSGANASCLAPVPDFTASVSASDNCSATGSLIITQSPVSGTAVGIGITNVTITVTDECGNQASCITTFTVTQEPVPVIITQPSDQNICLGSNAGFSIIATGTGLMSYQWQENTGSGWNNLSNGGVYSGVGISTLNLSSPPFSMNGYQYRCIVSSCSQQVISQAVTLSIFPVLLPGIALANQTICLNDIPAAIIATPPTGGSGVYTYQWQESADNITFNNIIGATTLSYSPSALLQTTYYRLSQTSGSGCGNVSTNVVTITVNPILVAGMASADQIICYNSAPATLNATLPMGGNGIYTYQWQISTDNFTFFNIPGANGLIYSPGTLSQTTYFRQMQTSGSGCGTVNTNNVKIIVYPILTAGIATTNQNICFSTIPSVINATDPTGGDGTYSYQWQISTDNILFINIPGATSLTYSPGNLTQTTYYRQAQTSGSGCGMVNTNVVTIIVYPVLNAGIAVANQTICYNSVPSAINASAPSGGDGTYTYQWQASTDNILFNNIPGATALSYSPGILTLTTFYRLRQISVGGCGVVTTNTVCIKVNPTFIAGLASADQSICYNNIPASLIATPATGGDGTYIYQWQISSDNINFTNIPGANGLSYSPGALQQSSYYRQSQTSGSGCGVFYTNVVEVLVYPILTAGIATSDQLICSNSVPSPINASTPSGGDGTYTYQWQGSTDNILFSNIPGAIALSYSPGILVQTMYYRQIQTSGSGCGTVTTNAVTITFNLNPTVVDILNLVCSDSPTGVIFNALPGAPASSYNITNIISNGLTASAGNPAIANGLAANVIADDAWTNPTGNQINIIYTIIPVSLAGCPGNAFTATIQVQGEPIVASQSLALCSDDASGIVLGSSSSVPVASYNIVSINSSGMTASAGNPIIGPGFSANALADDAWTNTGDASIDVIYTIIPVSGANCSGNPFTITLTVAPEPVVSNQVAQVACSGTSTGIILGAGSNISVISYNVIGINSNGLSASAGNPTTGTGFANDVIADDAWINPTPNAVNVIYTVIPVGNLGCQGNPFTVIIQVEPGPIIDFSTTNTCWGDTTFFILTGSNINSLSLWHWDFGDGTFWNCNSPGCGSEPHVFPFNGTYPVTLHVTDTNGCEYEVTHPVVILPLPVAFFSYNTPDCLGSAIQFTDLSQSPTDPAFTYIKQWVWDFGDGTPVQTILFPSDPNIFHSYFNIGTYQVTLTITNSQGCSDTFGTNITVTNRPEADFTYSGICEDATVQFQDASDENGGGEIISWKWDFGDPTSGINNNSDFQNPSHIFVTSGNFIVTLTVLNFNGCSDTVQYMIHVKPAPDANFTSTPGCIGSPTVFTADLLLTNAASIASCIWQFGDGNTANTPSASHNYSSPGNYLVILTITDTAGCEGYHTDTIKVSQPPFAYFSVNPVNCIGESVGFSNLSTSDDGYITTWNWDFGDSTTQSISLPANPDVSHNYLITGSYLVTLSVTTSNGCTDSEQIPVIMTPGPIARFGYQDGCLSEPVIFTDNSFVVGNTAITTWSWNFGDPVSGVSNFSNLQNPTHTYAVAGNYNVQLIISTANSCTDTLVRNLIISPLPPVDFLTQGACLDNPIQFTPNAGLMNMNTIASWFWQFGDGAISTSLNPTHIYTIGGNYNVTLSATDTTGCSNTITRQLQIKPLPLVNFNFTAPACQQSTIQFEDLTTIQTGYIVNWTWDFGDGTSQSINFPAIPNVNHTFSNAGSFNVMLTVKTNDSCTSQVTKTVIILAKPTARFTHSPGCEDLAVSFTDQSQGIAGFGISQHLWNFGDAASGMSNTSVVSNPIHIYNTAGTYPVKLIVFTINGCSDTLTQDVTVSPTPIVNFSSQPTCNGDTSHFTSSAFVNATTQSWVWQFGDGASSSFADPGHIYGQSGNFQVTLTIIDSSGCSNTITKQVIIPPKPFANFSSNTPGCSGLPMTFTDLTNPNGGTISNWHMDFGDATDTTLTSVPASMIHTYSGSGSFVVSLTVQSQSGCSDMIQHTITISPAPVSSFIYTNTCESEPAQFTDQSSLNGGTGIVGWLWNFGDPASGTGNTSTLQNPAHIYTTSGMFIATHVVINSAGCLDSVQSQVLIQAKPVVGFLNDSITCLGTPTEFFTDTTITNIGSIQTLDWNFGDGTPHSTQQNPVHTYSAAGSFTVTLSVTDTIGCGNTFSHEVSIHSQPTAAFTYAYTCEDSGTQFTDLSIAPAGEIITSWAWDFGDETSLTPTSILQNPVHTYSDPGSYSVTETVTTENGCSHSITLNVKIWPSPTAHFSYSTSPCSNGEVQFQDSSYTYQSTITDLSWEFEPYQYSSGQSPTHQFYNLDSTYYVKLIATNSRGCVDTTVQEVYVPATLAISFTHGLTCYGSPMQFTPQLSTPSGDSLLTFSWNFGNPQSGTDNTSGLKEPLHVYTGPGFFTVYLTSTDIYGCSATTGQSVEVKNIPVASFTYTPGLCDNTIHFTSTSADPSSQINTYIWNYGDGVTETIAAPVNTATHQYAQPGIYDVILKVINLNGCSGDITNTVQRDACLVSAFAQTDTLRCQNNAVTFTDQSTCGGSISQWQWTWGDGSQPTIYNSFKPTITHIFTHPGNYDITLQVTTMASGASMNDVMTMKINILASPLAGFATANVCLGEKATFRNTTNENGALSVDYLWDFGDPESTLDSSIMKDPEYDYTSAGIYNVRLIAINQAGCADTLVSPLMVGGLPKAAFDYGLACPGHPTQLIDQSDSSLAPITKWEWVVSDSVKRGYVSGQNAMFAFDQQGIYLVQLKVTDANGCADTVTQKVTVNPGPVSAFSITENYDNEQGNLQLVNGTINATMYHWDFGNGKTSSEETPVIKFADEGDYLIKLKAENGFGCIDTSSAMYHFIYKGLYVPNAFAPTGSVDQVRFFKPVGVNLASYNIKVYNSHGNIIWSSVKLDGDGSPVEYWDGTYKGNMCQQDVYVWKVKAVFKDGAIWSNDDAGVRGMLESGQVFGTVSLIR